MIFNKDVIMIGVLACMFVYYLISEIRNDSSDDEQI